MSFHEYGNKLVLESDLTIVGNLEAENFDAADVTIIDLTLQTLQVTNNTTLQTIQVTNNTTLQGPTNITNNLTVTGTTTLQGPTTVNNNITSTGTINGQTDVQVNGTSVVTTVVNLGDRDLFASKVGNTVNLRGLTNTDGRVTLTQQANNIEVNIPASIFPESFTWFHSGCFNPGFNATVMPDIIDGSSPNLNNAVFRWARWTKI